MSNATEAVSIRVLDREWPAVRAHLEGLLDASAAPVPAGEGS